MAENSEWCGLVKILSKQMWVVVNYSVKDQTETFFVNETEEKNKKNKNIWMTILLYAIPVFKFLSYIK